MKILPITVKYSYGSSQPQTKLVFGSSEVDTFVKNTENNSPFKEITSKTAQLLYNLDYTPISEPREGYFLTYALDKETLEPVDIYIKQLYKNLRAPKHPEYNDTKYCLYRKNTDGSLKLIGIRTMTFDIENKKISPGVMRSYDSTLLGPGHLEHMLAIKEMEDCGYNNVKIESIPEAFEFHQKAGFRCVDDYMYRSEHMLTETACEWADKLKISDREARKMFVFKPDSDIPLFSRNNTLGNFFIIMKKKGIKNSDQLRIEMQLTPQAIKEWLLLKAKLLK